MKHFNKPPKSSSGLRRVLPFLLALLFSSSLLAQVKTVTGSVTDATDKSGIPGATVKVVGTAQVVGTVTDIEGNYSINIPSGSTALQFSFVGMETKEVPISKSTINVALSPSSVAMDELVVVGYGVQKKETVVGSITQTKGDELLKAGSVTTVSEALTGLLPGVSTMQAAGQPGSTSATILIRGQSTWTDNSPMFVVDGVERDFNDLDPNEIESISVLKDASATAVYGVKGANGVILVTTKTGLKGKTRINFSANVGIKDPTVDTDYAADMATNLEYYNQAQLNDHIYDNLSPQFYIDRWRDPEYADNPYYQYTSFVNDLIDRGYTQQYNLNISGGNDFVTYFTSMGYNYDGDIFDIEEQPEFDPRTYQHRFNWRTNLDFNFTKTTKFSVKLSGDMTNWNGNPMTAQSSDGTAASGGSLMNRLYTHPMLNAPPVYEDGTLGMDNNSSVNVNYLGRLEREGSTSKKKNRLYTDFIFSQKIFKDLTAKAKFSYNYSRSYTSSISKEWDNAPIYYYVPSADGYNPDTDEDGNIIVSPDALRLDDWENPAALKNETLGSYNSNIYYELSLNYNHKFGDHDIGALALFQRRQAKNKANFPNLEESWVGRVTYGYRDRYLLEVNGAYNGNENFTPEKRFGFFPSIAGGWVLSEESFIKDNLTFVNFLKVRYSYGEIGSDKGLGGQRFPYLSSFSSSSLPFEYGYMPSIGGNNKNGLSMVTEGQPAVSDVTWETAVKQNIGLEVNFLENRLQSTIDLFDEKRKNILMQRQSMPVWYGNDYPYANIGETKNHGFEIEITWNDKIGDDLNYWLKSNISISENRIVSRDDAASTPDYRKQAGKPIGWSSGYVDMGLLQNWDDVYASANSSFLNSYIPGDMTYNDYNGDGIINVNDKVAIGNPSYASKTYAISGGLRYKGFSFTVMLNGMYDLSKSITYNYLYANSRGVGSSLGYMLKNNEQLDAWSPTNTNTDVPVLHSTASSHYEESSTYSLRNSSFLRLRNVELKYELPESLLNRINFFEKMEIYVNGNNLYTWQKLPRALDPEAKKLEVYPITKRYNVGLRFTL